MKKINMSGVIPALITPMHEDESVNTTELCNQVDRMIEGGVHAIFCLGTNGEAYILSQEDKILVMETVIRHTNGRVPVYVGTGCISTKETVELSRRAMDAGADILSLITPSFASASPQEIYSHYAAVAKAVDIPLVLYNIPARTGNTLSPQLMGRLAGEFENIVGVKDSSGNFDNMLQYIEARPANKDFSVLSGNDSLILWNLYAGGNGGIAGCANIYPHTLSSIYNCFINGDLAQARVYQDSIRSLRNCFKYGNPNTVVKTAVALLGHPVGKCRAPFNQLSEEGIQALQKVLDENREKGMC
ncbi:4-hydroxy-tetrahydrodipicolinate synthase [Oscillospiraceae bacterium MB08-C2-2]|nr:4-hydroxy-tetrahydrodipicolinate synthase [Oscillospiraceae bacterium MB08-C2-2]